MIDTNIHNGLPEKEIRDFLSEQIMLNILPSKEMEVHKYDYLQDAYIRSLNNLQIDLRNTQREIKRTESMIAIRKMIELKGWTEFDCSDHVGRENHEAGWRNFIGTEEEFNHFMKENGFEE